MSLIFAVRLSSPTWLPSAAMVSSTAAIAFSNNAWLASTSIRTASIASQLPFESFFFESRFSPFRYQACRHAKLESERFILRIQAAVAE